MIARPISVTIGGIMYWGIATILLTFAAVGMKVRQLLKQFDAWKVDLAAIFANAAQKTGARHAECSAPVPRRLPALVPLAHL